MKNYIAFIVLSLLQLYLNAQTPSGVCVLSKDSFSKPLINVHVQFDCLDCKISEKAKLSLTNSKGNVLNPFRGSTQIYVTYIGYESILDTLKKGEFKTLLLVPKVIEVNEVVITAQYAPNSLEKAVHKIKVIDRKKIELMGAVNLEDVLTNEANVRISQDNVLGSSTSIQGVSGQNVKILIDGVPVIGRLGGNIDLSQINLNDIERIEIIEGPLSVEYGSNALAGTINLITKKVSKEKVNFTVNSFYETVGQTNISAALRFKIKKTRINFSAGRNYFDGWSVSDPLLKIQRVNKADSTRVNDWKPKQQYFAKINTNGSVKKWNYNLSSDYFNETIDNKGSPRPPYFETAFDDYYKTDRWSNNLSISRKVRNSNSLMLLFAYNLYKRTKNTYYVDLTNLNKKLTENASDQDTSIFNLVMARGTYSSNKKNKKLNYGIGYDINIETGRGARIEEKSKTIGDYAGFISAEYSPVKKVTIRPGLRYAYNSSYNAPLTSSLNTKIVHKNYIIRASYSQGFRAPSIKDLYFNFVDINHDIQGNPDLKAETSDNFSFSAVKTILKNTKVFKISTSGFYNDIHNLIALAISEGSSYSYFNLDRYKTFGGLLNLELAIEHFKFSVGGTHTGRYNSLSEELAIEKFSYSPEIRSSIFYHYRRYNIQFAAFYKYSGKVIGYYIDDEDAVQQSLLGDFNTLDLTVTKGFLSDHIKWTIGGKNLLDVTSITSIGSTGVHSSNTGIVPMSWGRSFFTSLKININKKLFKRRNEKVKAN